MWIPGYTTRNLEEPLRNQSSIGNNSSIHRNLENRTAMQYMNYRTSDIFTVQQAQIFRFNQGMVVNKIGALDAQPRLQLSDIIAARMAENG